MSLQEIKNEVCIKNNFAGWKEFIYTCQDVSITNNIIDELMKTYAMECLKRASDEVNKTSYNSKEPIIKIITNENNIIK